MKNPELYHKTIGILVKAYLNDTLVRTDCTRCAVGNLVASSVGINLKTDHVPFGVDDPYKNTGLWYDFFHSNRMFRELSENAKIQCSLTGYTPEQLCQIEHSCMWLNGHTWNEQERVYMGLIQVVDKLGEIHECDKETIQESKLMFVKC